MIVKVLGTGCKKCQNLETKVKEVIAKNDVKAEVEKVQEIADIMKYNVMMTPALVINEKVVSTGVIPKDDEILTWLKEGK
ncbi:MAG: thioredoxin family protein [Melioribacteraceae bacterium]|nr:thioredoxin family protein [Melioribacteraceae bacterium]